MRISIRASGYQCRECRTATLNRGSATTPGRDHYVVSPRVSLRTAPPRQIGVATLSRSVDDLPSPTESRSSGSLTLPSYPILSIVQTPSFRFLTVSRSRLRRLRRSFFVRAVRRLVPVVESPTTLLPEPSGAHHFPEQGWRAKLLPQLSMQVLGNGETHIEPHQIGEPQWPHRVSIT